MTKTFCSAFIPLDKVSNAQGLTDDWTLFNQMLRESLSMKMTDILFKEKYRAEHPDAPKGKPGGGQRKEGGSVHTALKDKHEVTSYFVTAVESCAEGITKSSKECFSLSISTKEDRVQAMKDKINKLDKEIKNLTKVKQSLKARSKARKAGKKIPKFRAYQGCPFQTEDVVVDGKVVRTVFTIIPFSKRNDKHYIPKVFENDYLFELKYVDSSIRKKKRRKKLITGRMRNLEAKIAALKNRQKQGKISCRLISLKKTRKWKNCDEQERRRLTQKHRMRAMLIPGRRDAPQGNWVVRYDTETRTLTYRIASAKTKDYIQIPNVVFAYGQDKIDEAVLAVKENQTPVTWGVRFSRNKIQIQCTIQAPDNPFCNSCMTDGVIGIDKNYDNISVVETNGKGQILNHRIISFHPEKKSSGQYEQTLSLVLEKVFAQCVESKKPLVCEDIQRIRQKPLYQNKKRNRHISMFAYRTIQQLIYSKGNKYNVAISEINPAYTSQIGKYKYAKPYGLSVHEAAAYVIARRGQRRKERVPQSLRILISEDKKTSAYLKQWKSVLKRLNSNDN